VSALSENDNKYLCFVVLKLFLLLVKDPEFCLVLLHQSWSSVVAPWYTWFGEGVLCAVLHQHPHGLYLSFKWSVLDEGSC
jgi:hypothetical protein